MFNNRYTRQLPVETRKTIVRPSLSHQPMSYGQMNWGMVENRDSRLWNRELRHDQHLNHDVRDLSREHLIGNGVSTYTTAADVLELDEQFIIEVALPGVVLDDVHLKIEDNVLSISAKRTPTLFEERAIVLQKELPSHYILRQFEFDTEIIAEQIEARLDRGILYISIPKVEVALRIPVSSGMIDNHAPSTPKSRISSKHEVTVK